MEKDAAGCRAFNQLLLQEMEKGIKPVGAHTGHNSAESMRENGFSGESGFTQKIHHGNVSAQIAAPAHAHGCEYSDITAVGQFILY